jgi:hypothetical protein
MRTLCRACRLCRGLTFRKNIIPETYFVRNSNATIWETSIGCLNIFTISSCEDTIRVEQVKLGQSYFKKNRQHVGTRNIVKTELHKKLWGPGHQRHQKPAVYIVSWFYLKKTRYQAMYVPFLIIRCEVIYPNLHPCQTVGTNVLI